MYKDHKSRVLTFTGLLFICTMLSACLGGGSNSVKFYLVNPVDLNTIRTDSDKHLAIEIINLHVPEYLERSHIAVRTGENSLQFSEFNQWGENLRKNLMRTMAINLSRALSTSDISTPLSRSSSVPDYRLEIHIDEFDKDEQGVVRLNARWQLISGAEYTPLGIQQAELESPYEVGERDFDQMVGEMRVLYGELSSLIAQSILAQQGEQ